MKLGISVNSMHGGWLTKSGPPAPSRGQRQRGEGADELPAEFVALLLEGKDADLLLGCLLMWFKKKKKTFHSLFE